MEKDLTLCTLEEVRTYLKEDTAKQNAIWREKYGYILRAKNAVWLLLLVIAFLQVYMVNIMIGVASLELRPLLNPASATLIHCPPSMTRR